MSDDRYILDELMNEYSGKSGGDMDLDSILGIKTDQPPFEPEMEKRRMELIKKEIISGDYEHRYLKEDYQDVIDEEKRRKEDKARKIAEISRVMEERADMEATAIFSQVSEPASLSQHFKEAVESSVSGDTVSFDRSAVLTSAAVNKIDSEKTMAVPVIKSSMAPAPAPAPAPVPAPKPPVNTEPPKKKLIKKRRLTDEDEDEFQRKYEELTRRGLGVKSRAERGESAASEAFDEVVSEMEKRAGPGRTFSEKAESDSPYGDTEEPRRKKKTPMAVTDRSGLVSYTQNNSRFDAEIRMADDPLDSITGNNVDKLLSEREKTTAFNAATMKIGEKTNTLSNFLDKLMKSDEQGAGKKAERGNTELMENMKKAKKDRLSKTSNIPPVERNSFTDVRLNINDKIIDDSDEEKTSEEEMMNTVLERSSARKKDFKFIGDEEDSNDDDSDGSYIDDFENIDDAEAIAEDIEQSKNSMVMRLLVLLICFLLSLYITVSNELKAPVFEFVSMTDEPSAYLFVNTLLGMVAAFAAYNAVAVGITRLFTLQANCDSYAALTSMITIALSMVGLLDTGLVRDGILHEYVPMGIAALIFNTLGKLLLLDRTQRNFRYISGDYEHYAMFTVKNEELAENFTKGSLTDFPTLAAMRKTEMVSDFMKNSYAPDMSDRFCRMFAPIVLVASLVIGVIGAAAAKADYGGRAVYIGITSFVSCMCLCSCFSSMLTVNLPMRKAAVRFNGMQGALIGFDAIDEFSETNSILADACQLFPKGTVSLANIKIFSDTRIDEAIVEAASLACRSESIMNNMFYDIINGKTSMLDPVESYIYEDSMGLCGWINNKRVLLGNRKLMENHSIDGIPSLAKEKQYTKGGKTVPVYLSISGELSAMFLINLIAAPGVAAAMRELNRNQIKVILRSVDSAVTVERMAKMFDVSPGMLKILPFRTHSDYEKVTSYTPKQSSTLVCSGRFGALAALIVSTKRIRATVMAGIAVQAVSILLGILLAALLVLFKAYPDLSAGTLLLYNLIFTAIYFLINLFRKV